MDSVKTAKAVTVRRAALGALLALSLVALFATRFWSSRSSFRQMRIFAPSARVENFRTMSALFPANTVRRGSAPRAFAVREEPLPTSYTYRGKPGSIGSFLERTVTTGLLVARDDVIVHERYFLGATRESKMTSWSVAKSVVSLLVGIARDEGRLRDLAAPLARYAPVLEGSAYGAVPLRDALTMSSGIRFREEYGDPTSDIHTFFARVFYLHESIPHHLRSLNAEEAPGARFHYTSMDTLAMGLALRNAVQKPLAEYLHEKLWAPLGMEYDANWNSESDDGGTELAFCCLNVTVRDYAKIGRLMMRGGDWDGRRIVSEEWVRESTRPEAPRLPDRARGTWGYQYQWWIPGVPGAFMAAGVWGQFVYVDPARRVVIVKTSVDPEFDAHGPEAVAVFEAIAAAL